MLLYIFIPDTILWAQGIYINEILASNDNSIQAQDGEHYDWIELYNSSSSPVSVAGYYLTDDLTEPNKFQLNHSSPSNLTIPANGYLILYASGETQNGPRHIDFKLSAGGEELGLFSPGLVQIDTLVFGEQKTYLAYGRETNGTGSFKYLIPATPGQSNGNATSYSGFLSPPNFSKGGGFFDAPFNLTLSHTDPNVQIIYTLDGSRPDKNNLSPLTYHYKNSYPEQPGQSPGALISATYQSYGYSSPIEVRDRSSEANTISLISSSFHHSYQPYLPSCPIEKVTVIRAVATKPGFLPSETITHSFFAKVNGEKKYPMPVVSITFNENEMFDYWEGISVAGNDFDNFRAGNQSQVNLLSLNVGNYYRSGRQNEIIGNFEYFEGEDQSVNQQIGLRVHGNRSRHYPQKSLRLYARSEYGKNDID